MDKQEDINLEDDDFAINPDLGTSYTLVVLIFFHSVCPYYICFKL